MTQSSQHIATALVHHPYRPPQEFDSLQPAVHKASTILFPNTHAARTRGWLDKSGYTYGLHGTPTTYTLEERLCALEGGRHCLLAPSGLSAISTVMLALLQAGDEILIPDNAYGPAKDFAIHDLKRFGIHHAVYDPMNLQDLRSKLSPATKMIWMEAPGSVTMEFPDLPALVQTSRQHGALAILDNTWGAGLAFAPFDLLADGGSLSVDISVHALTKYPSGGGDILMGSIMTTDQALHRRIQMTHIRLGIGIGANDAEHLLRALPTTALRYQAHDTTARHLATALQRQQAVVQILHPAFASSPGHVHWQRLCGHTRNAAGAAAGLFSIVIDPRYGQAAIDRFCDSLQLFGIGYSWGGPMSLVMPYDLDSMRHCGRKGIAPGTVVRFCTGLEAANDLEQDLAQAYEQAFGLAWQA